MVNFTLCLFYNNKKKERDQEKKNSTKITKTKSSLVTPSCPFPAHLPTPNPPFPNCVMALAVLYPELPSSTSLSLCFSVRAASRSDRTSVRSLASPIST